jgi:hypothetical protein
MLWEAEAQTGAVTTWRSTAPRLLADRAMDAPREPIRLTQFSNGGGLLDCPCAPKFVDAENVVGAVFAPRGLVRPFLQTEDGRAACEQP